MTVLIDGFAEALNVVAKRLVIWIAGIGFDGGNDGVGCDEARYIVDMAVSVVPGDAAAEPDHVGDAEIVAKYLVVIFCLHRWIAMLGGAEQAFFSREQGAKAIGVNGAAFKDDAGLANCGSLSLCARDICHSRADFLIALVIRIFCPGIEAPGNSGESGVGFHECAA